MSRLSFLFVLFVFCLACSSPQKHFEKGNYQKAFEGALKDLEKNSSDRKQRNLLNRSFERILSDHGRDWDLALRSNHIEDWENIYFKRNDLINDYYRAKRWLKSDFQDQLVSIEAEGDDLRIDLAENYFQMGEESMQRYNNTGDKILAQEAYEYYRSSEKFDDENLEIKIKIDEAFEAGSINILFEADAWDISDEWAIDRRFRELRRNSKGFYKVYYEEPVGQVDCLVEIDFSRIDIREDRKQESREYQKEIQNGYETVTDSTGTVQRPVYITVSATVDFEITQRQYFWEARSRVDLIDNYCNYRANDFSISRNYSIENYKVRGDRRAVPDQYKQDNFRAQFDERDILEEMTDELYRQIERYYF